MTGSSPSVVNLFPEKDGNLGVIEFSQCPFEPQRLFWIYEVQPEVMRANHAHRSCHQLLICMVGTVTAVVTSMYDETASTILNAGDSYHLMPLNWLQLVDFSEGAVLAVLASQPYRHEEYVNSFAEFEHLGKQQSQKF